MEEATANHVFQGKEKEAIDRIVVVVLIGLGSLIPCWSVCSVAPAARASPHNQLILFRLPFAFRMPFDLSASPYMFETMKKT